VGKRPIKYVSLYVFRPVIEPKTAPTALAGAVLAEQEHKQVGGGSSFPQPPRKRPSSNAIFEASRVVLVDLGVFEDGDGKDVEQKELNYEEIQQDLMDRICTIANAHFYVECYRRMPIGASPIAPLQAPDVPPPTKIKPIGLCSVLLFRSEKGILLTRRPLRQMYYSGCWVLPGGRCERGETCIGAAFREFAEECGIDLISAMAQDLSASDGAGNESTLPPLDCNEVLDFESYQHIEISAGRFGGSMRPLLQALAGHDDSNEPGNSHAQEIGYALDCIMPLCLWESSYPVVGGPVRAQHLIVFFVFDWEKYNARRLRSTGQTGPPQLRWRFSPSEVIQAAWIPTNRLGQAVVQHSDRVKLLESLMKTEEHISPEMLPTAAVNSFRLVHEAGPTVEDEYGDLEQSENAANVCQIYVTNQGTGEAHLFAMNEYLKILSEK